MISDCIKFLFCYGFLTSSFFFEGGGLNQIKVLNTKSLVLLKWLYAYSVANTGNPSKSHQKDTDDKHHV